MAVLRPEVEFRMEGIWKLIDQFPSFSGAMLALIGKRARTLLRDKYLSGQEIRLKSGDRDKKGRYMITSDVNKRRTTMKLYSYPVNLFEKGRGLRDGSREPGKYIITRKLKQDLMSRTASYVTEFENKILSGELKKIGL